MSWVTTSPVRESDIASAMFTETSVNDYEKPCDTSFLGLKENFAKFIGKHLWCQSLFFNKVARLGLNFIKKETWHRCFPVNFAKFLRTPFYRTPPEDCFCDVLGLKESHYKHDNYAYEKLKKQLKREEDGWYETWLVWKEEYLPLGDSKIV